MKSIAKLRYLRIAPRKVRLVVNLIRGKNVEQAQTMLKFVVKKGSLPVLKLLQSALASAKRNFNAVESNLYISKITVDEGPKLKRMMPRARGQGYEIQKKTSHITIELSETVPTVKSEKVAEGAKPTSVLPVVGTTAGKPKFKIANDRGAKPKEVRGIQRIFRRKAI